MKNLRVGIPAVAMASLLLAPFAMGSFQATSDDHAATKVDAFVSKELSSVADGTTVGVFVHSKSISGATNAISASGMKLVQEFRRVNIAYALGTSDQIERLRHQSQVTRIEADRPMKLFLDTAHKATRDDEALSGFRVDSTDIPGVDGTGITIAVIDGGVDGTHPMFNKDGHSKVVRNLKLICGAPGDSPCAGSPGYARDGYFVEVPDSDTISLGGHGTHVNGIAAGYPVEGAGKHLRGTAPGAKLVDLSVGLSLSIYGGAAGLNWVLEHHSAPCGTPTADCPPIRVASNSWGLVGGGEFNPDDLVSQLETLLVSQGVVVTFANGNDGGDGTSNVSSPYAENPAPGVIGVANYDDADSGTRDGSLDSSSSRGMQGRPDTYPDISAPGTNITSACRAYLAICRGGPDDDDPDYGTISGTSMATPMVSGIVAQLFQANPNLSPGQVETIIKETAYRFTAGGSYEADPNDPASVTSFDKGHGLIDAKAALAKVHGITLNAASATPTQLTDARCEGNTVATDTRGDTYLVELLPSSASPTDIPPYDPALDITKADIHFDEATHSLSARIFVADLSGLSSEPAPDSWMFTFDHNGNTYYLEAYADPTGQRLFTFGQLDQVRMELGSATGAFDTVQSRIAISISNSDMSSAGLKPFTDGDGLSNMIFTTRHSAHTGLVTAGVVSDDASSSCEFVIGSELGILRSPKVNANIGADSPTFSWNAGPFTREAPTLGSRLNGDDCSSTKDPKCDSRAMKVQLPIGETEMKVAIHSDDKNADFDLYLFDPKGRSIASSAGSGSTESIDITVKDSGVYTVAVDPFSASDSHYSGSISLVISPPPDPDPSPGTFDGAVAPTGSYVWQGQGLNINPVFTCSGAEMNICDVRKVWVKAPTAGGRLKVHIIHPENADLTDLSLYVNDPSGRLIGSATNGGHVQDVSVYVRKRGVYTIAVTGVSPGGTYDGSVGLGCPADDCNSNGAIIHIDGPITKKSRSRNAPKKYAPLGAHAVSASPAPADAQPDVSFSPDPTLVVHRPRQVAEPILKVKGIQNQRRVAVDVAAVLLLATAMGIGWTVVRRRFG
ncbi:MAG: S8 family serine peptidase [Actinomycetota bacterium]|nr:S8 family serine peptidase [Actinomycetota bacterium]